MQELKARPVEPIRLSVEGELQRLPAERASHIFLRLVALLIIGRSLFIWFSLTGVLDAIGYPLAFEAVDSIALAVAIVHAVVGVLAGIGLWLLAAWGMVMWFVIIAADAVIFLLFDDFFRFGAATVSVNAGLVAIYIGLYVMVRRQIRERGDVLV